MISSSAFFGGRRTSSFSETIGSLTTSAPVATEGIRP